ncbi:hypothetical protein LIER_34176 [Lithospermum erythrorhizon]|uniref:Secreted protein n=1 Tax=Lithospermum erythrorhizon TaxID=34254 RepID=A0AAV3RYX3_LITER
MPFSLSFFSFLSSSLWMVFGILSHDIFIMVCPTRHLFCIANTEKEESWKNLKNGMLRRRMFSSKRIK